MEETAFRQARKAVVEHPCPFEKALLAGCGSCAQAQRRHIAEREAVACREADARASCTVLLGLLRRNAAFALHLAHPEERPTHAREMKVQCGGVAGLRRVLADESDDIGALVQTACRAEAGPKNLPWSTIMQSVAAWQPRRRARRP